MSTYAEKFKASFYGNLKDGTKSVLSHIFIAGVSPMMMNDLSSDLNIADNLSLAQHPVIAYAECAASV